MAKDYIADTNSKKRRQKQKQKKGQHKILLLFLILLIIAGFVTGLYFLKTKTKKTNTLINVKPEKSKSVLPTPPEEVWSYIKALETRTVPVDNNISSLEKDMHLSDEQNKILLELEKEQKAMELAKIKQTEENKKIKKQNIEEKLQNSINTTNKTKLEIKTKIDTTAEVVVAKPVYSTKSVQNRPTTNSATRKFGLQCGAFKNRTQAENIQARLSMLGFDARINRNGEWNRVIVGPIGNRSTTKVALDKAKSVENCVLIGM